MSHLEIWYCAAPVGASDAAGVAANLARAGRWLRWLRLRCPNVVIIAPWLGPLLAGLENDGDPADRARGLRDCCAVVERCDGIILVGGRVSAGMQREVDAVCEYGQGRVADLTSLGEEPPADYDEQFPDFFEEPHDPLELGMLRWEAP